MKAACPICGKPLTGNKSSACSRRCRMIKWALKEYEKIQNDLNYTNNKKVLKKGTHKK